MRKFLFKSFFVAGLFFSTNSIKAQCSLDQVGAVNYVSTSQLSDIAVAPNKVLYSIAFNTSTGKYQVYSGMTASSWTLTATLSGSTTVKPSIHINKAGKVSIFLRDDNNGGVGKVYVLNAGVLNQQGANVTTGAVSNLSMISDASGDEYVAYTDIQGGNKAVVKKWNSGSSVWTAIGGPVSAGTAAYNSLILTGTDMPVLAFQDGTQGNKTSVMKFNGSVWVSVGIIGGSATNSKLRLASNGDFYLGFTETGGNTIVQKYDGASWTPVGGAITGLSSANSFDLELDPVNVPFITGILSTPPYPVAYKFTGVPTWSNVIGSGYLNSATSTNPNLEIDYTGTPYFFYVDQPANYALNVKTLGSTLFLSSHPVTTTACNGQVGSFNVGVGGGSPLGYQWQVSSSGSFTNAGAPYSNPTTSSLSFVASGGINQNKVRCVLNAGCKNIVSNTATLTVVSPSLSLVATNPICAGSCNGSITSTTSGGSAPYIYNWSNGSTTQNIAGLCAGVYSLTTTDATGCTATANTSVIDPPAINSLFSGNQTICSGTPTSLTITASNGVPAYTYSWSPAAGLSSTTGQVVSANPSSTQTYNVQIIDANGCVATNTVMITVNPLPSVSGGPDNTICFGGMTTLMGTGANTYTWVPGNLVGQVQNVSPVATTVYTVVGTNTLTGCTNSDNVMVFVNSMPVANAGPSRTLTCANTFTTLAGSGGGTYSWAGPGITAGGSTATPTVNLPGTYSLTVVVGGCSSNVSTVTVSQNTVAPSPTASNTGPITCGSPNISLNGMPGSGVSYLWSGPGITGSTNTQNTTANVAGSYTLQVTNLSNGCSNYATTIVSQNTTPPSATASNSGTLTCSLVTVGLTATGGGTYNWAGPSIVSGATTANPVVNASGCYTVVVTSAVNGCTASATSCVSQNTTAPTTSTNVSGTLNCTLTSVNASASTSVSPVSYNWTGSGITSATNISTITVNAGGVKNYTVTNTSNGCITTGSLNVVQNLLTPSPTASSTGTITCITNTIQLAGTPASGVTYTWTAPGGSSIVSGTNSQNAIGNGAGTYTLSVTMISSGCANSKTVAVIQNTAAPSVSSSISNSLTCVNVTADASVSTLATPVSFTWSGSGILTGNGTPTITTNSAGIKSYTVTNTANGCFTAGNVSVPQNTVIPSGLSAGTNQTITCGSPSVTLSGSISSPTNASVSWSGGVCGPANTLITNACSPGTYSLTATDPANGCTLSSTVAVFADASVPTVTLSSPSGTLTCVTTSVTISAISNPSSVAYSWLPTSGIVPGTESTSNPAFISGGTYSVVITNTVNGCATTVTASITQNTLSPTITISALPSVICAGNSSTLTATGAVSYNWNTGPTSNSIVVSPSVNTSYTVTGAAANGCTGIASQVITVNATPVLTVTGNTTICKGSTAVLTAMGATTYTWNTGVNTVSISTTPSITTTYTVIGSNGICTSTSSKTVLVIPSKDINGVITSTTGATNGDVTLFKYISTLSKWDSVTTVPFTSSYSFSGIDSALYVVRAVPSSTNIQVTYGDSAISWQGATVIDHGCAVNTSQNIKLLAFETFVPGPGVLIGTITEGNGFGQKINSTLAPTAPGNPIGGIIVKGGKNPGGQMLVQTVTDDATGSYTLSGLPLNTGSESYFIFVDIPGLDTNGTYHVIVSSGNTQHTNLNFYVDSMYIHPNTVTYIAGEYERPENKIVLYPNPAQHFTNIQYELTDRTEVSIDIYDVMGKKVERFLPPTEQVKNKYSQRITTRGLGSGIYFVHLTFNTTETVIKLVVTE